MKISIVIPVYNVARFLPACLDSLLAQTFRDWTCILVDDGSDDGSSEMNEPDHLYRTTVEYGKDTCVVVPERIFDDVTRQGEIEGLSFDKEKKQLLLLYNRGVRVVNGRSQGFYDGYHREISEVFIYDIE